MTLGDYLNTLAAKLSLQNDPALISLLSNSALAHATIADEFANKMNAGLMSIDGAKSSPEVKRHFDALALKAIDDKLMPLAQRYGATAEFEAEKSTYKRVDILNAKIAAAIAEIEAKAAKGDVTKDSEVKRLTGELQKLQTQLTTVTSAKDTEIANLKATHEKAMLDSLVNFSLSGKPYSNKSLDNETNVTIARAILDSELSKRGAIIINENGQLRLKNAATPELDLLDEGNKPITFAGFTDKLLAEKNLLEVTKTATPPTTPQFQFQPSKTEGMESFNAAAQSALADISGNN